MYYTKLGSAISVNLSCRKAHESIKREFKASENLIHAWLPEGHEGKHLKAIRADSAAYQAAIINHCKDNGQQFAIGAKLDKTAQA